MAFTNNRNNIENTGFGIIENKTLFYARDAKEALLDIGICGFLNEPWVNIIIGDIEDPNEKINALLNNKAAKNYLDSLNTEDHDLKNKLLKFLSDPNLLTTQKALGFHQFGKENKHVGLFGGLMNGDNFVPFDTGALAWPPFYHEEGDEFGPGEHFPPNGNSASKKSEKGDNSSKRATRFINREDYHMSIRKLRAEKNKYIRDVMGGKAVEFELSKYRPILKDLQAGILKQHQKKYAFYCLIKFPEYSDLNEEFKNNSWEDWQEEGGKIIKTNSSKPLKRLKKEAFDKHKDLEKAEDSKNRDKDEITKLTRDLNSLKSQIHRLTVRNWISKLNPTNAFDQLLGRRGRIPEIPKITGVYLTHECYKYLGIPKAYYPGKWNEAFKDGLSNRGIFKNDELKLQREEDEVYKKDQIHLMIFKGMNSEENLRKEKRKLKKRLKKFGLKKGKDYKFEYAHLSTKREPFGFRDGLSNPKFFPASVAASEIDEKSLSSLDLVLAKDPCGGGSKSYGSFVAHLKLEQNIEEFKKAAREFAKKIYKTEEPTIAQTDRAAAYFIGRTKDGKPLINLKDGEPTIGPYDDFDYSSDPHGMQCPIPAHIRQANPRTESWKRRQIVRRGSPYRESKSGKRGLFFISFQRDLIEQFEATVRNISTYSYGDSSNGPDPIGNEERHRYWEYNNHKNPDEKVWFSFKEKIVSYRGGYYFFAPSLSFFNKLKQIAPDRKYEEDKCHCVKGVFGLDIINDKQFD